MDVDSVLITPWWGAAAKAGARGAAIYIAVDARTAERRAESAWADLALAGGVRLPLTATPPSRSSLTLPPHAPSPLTPPSRQSRTASQVRALFCMADLDSSGFIDFYEFLNAQRRSRAMAG